MKSNLSFRRELRASAITMICIVLTDNFQFECGRYLALIARTNDARCDTIVQTIVSEFVQLFYVQIVANLLNAMVVTDECIWIELQKGKKENRWKKALAKIKSNRNKINFRARIFNQCEAEIDLILLSKMLSKYFGINFAAEIVQCKLTVVRPGVLHPMMMWQRAFQCYRITIDRTYNGSWFILVDVEVTVAHRCKNERRDEKKTYIDWSLGHQTAF